MLPYSVLLLMALVIFAGVVLYTDPGPEMVSRRDIELDAASDEGRQR